MRAVLARWSPYTVVAVAAVAVARNQFIGVIAAGVFLICGHVLEVRGHRDGWDDAHRLHLDDQDDDEHEEAAG